MEIFEFGYIFLYLVKCDIPHYEIVIKAENMIFKLLYVRCPSQQRIRWKYNSNSLESKSNHHL